MIIQYNNEQNTHKTQQSRENNPKYEENRTLKMAELNKSNFTEEFHIDLHGSSIKLNRLAIGHIELI